MPDKDKATVTVPGLVAKLTKILGQVGGIPKDQKHQQGWMYRSEDALMERLRPLFAGEGILCLPSEDSVTTLTVVRSSEGKEGSHFAVRVGYTFIDAATGETLGPYYMTGEAADWGDRALQKAQTFAGKAFLSKVFMISCGDDVSEGNGESKVPGVQVPRKSDQPTTAATPPPAEAPAEPPAEREPGDDDGLPLPVLITSVDEKDGIGKNKKPFHRYVVRTSDNKTLSTFDTAVGDLARKACDEHNPVILGFVEKDGFLNLTAVEWM
jgi:hypothetical protein